MNITKTLIEEPELKIQANDDGVWLHFKASDGSFSSINLPNYFGKERSMADRTIQQWSIDYNDSLI